ncbi:MAG: ATP-dependent Clp protease proteolytic subunit [Pseudomonadota bacterium]
MSEENKDNKEEQDAGSLGARLIKARQVLICEEISQKMALRVLAQLLALAHESDDDITLFLNSQGGHVEAGDSIHDIIRFIKPRVRIIGTGWVASAGTHIFLAVDKEDRVCLPNTRFLIHQPAGGVGGQATDISIQARQIEATRTRLAKTISEATGQPFERVMEDIDRDYWMNTAEAIEYGIVDRVITTSDEMA